MVELYVVTCTVHGTEWTFSDVSELSAFLLENMVGDAVYTIKRELAGVCL